MDALGRYYTNEVISSLLINNFESESPKKVLDLGVGDASLTIAANARWRFAKFFGTEIENGKAVKVGKALPYLNIIRFDTLKPNASTSLKIKFGSIDIAICNPPYVKVEDKSKYVNLFKSVGCTGLNNLQKISSEIVFFAHNLKLLKANGELGIIVSDSLITGKHFRIFREVILKRFNVRRIIQLQDNVFAKTEARAHIIFISKTKPVNRTCEIFIADNLGSLSRPIEVDKNLLVERMDYQYHKSKSIIVRNVLSLKDIGAVIKRGRYSYKELRDSKLPYFHSTNFKEFGLKVNFTKHLGSKHESYAAHQGDILFCRVGKRILGKVAYVNSGSVVNSDCVYKITVPKRYQKTVLNSLVSDQGNEWIRTYAHGVCSQVISKSDLELFPLFSLLSS
jgi:type I restriction enzyme M protein